ncbi:cytochrome c554 [Cronobacter dublinensis 1210]|uniref:Cytochrome c554 n=1 Tax=Cronobacter dublinensis 1210 TaxID=1208656 RepID=A0ABP1W8A2_9ENTR|nr:cytochrome c554 [Cronobacter dublinensis 1210]
MSKQLFWLACLLGLSLTAQAKGDPAAGEEKAVMCVACHGATGKASAPLYPNLAGQNEAYLEHALQAYKKRRAQRRPGGDHEGVRQWSFG